VLLRAFLISALNIGKHSASRPGRFTPKEEASDIHSLVVVFWVVTPCSDMGPT
jgi:hypothetical protein